MDEIPGLVQLTRLPNSARADLLAGSPDVDPLLAVTTLRRERPDLSPELASAVVAQRGYQAKARATGALPEGGPWLTTEVGLEQASRPEVAAHRAATLAAAGVRSVVDASAGIGIDARGFLEAGLAVVAIERDPVTFEVCRANLGHAVELFGTEARVENADSTQVGVITAAVDSLPSPVAVFIDPARRGTHRPVDGSRSRSERDRQLWSPPWSFVDELRRQFEWVAVKAPPGFAPDAPWKAEWVAVGNSVVECALYSPHASRREARGAIILGDDVEWHLNFDIDAQRPVPSGLRDFLAEVHPVARRTGAIAEICLNAPDLAPVTESSMWLTADSPAPTSPALRWFEVLGSGSLDQLTAMCRDQGIDRVALKTLESKRSQREMRARIGLPDGDEFAIVAIDGFIDHILVRRMRQR
ncbi:MAG: hypothetical protein O2815_03760 [Actinomycetota bacterium]|nr:hypothetical protein [Actinomycetota bacterium]